MYEYLLSLLSPHTKEEKEILKGEKVDPEIFSDKALSVVTNERINRMGQQIILSQHYRFTALPSHTHEYIEVCYVCRGKLVHRINNDVEITVKAGELLLLNRHAYHSIDICTEEDIAVNFLVLPSFFDTTMTIIGQDNTLGRFLINAVSEKNKDISFLYFRVSDIPTIQNLVENMIYSLLEKGTSSVKEEKLTMGLLFLELLSYSERMTVKSYSGNENLVAQALREIEENTLCASLSSVAEKNHISSAYLSRVIKENTGSTFKELLMEKRLLTAKTLLEETRLPITQVAEVVGYDNVSFFYKIFKNKFGETPKKYRTGLK